VADTARLPAASGIVLAGGRSSRFGRDKLVQPVQGRPAVHLAILALAAVCREVIVVRPPGEPIELPGGMTVPAVVVHDERPYEGPLAGTSAGLAVASQPLALVVGGDMPGLIHAVLTILLKVAEGSERSAVALAESGHLRPLPCVVRRDARLVAEGLLREGRRSLHDFLNALEVELVDEELWRALDPFARTLADIDLPDDVPEALSDATAGIPPDASPGDASGGHPGAGG
jgi:molybdopterin-guanine dinucleotide biosynthesis protein A